MCALTHVDECFLDWTSSNGALCGVEKRRLLCFPFCEAGVSRERNGPARRSLVVPCTEQRQIDYFLCQINNPGEILKSSCSKLCQQYPSEGTKSDAYELPYTLGAAHSAMTRETYRSSLCITQRFAWDFRLLPGLAAGYRRQASTATCTLCLARKSYPDRRFMLVCRRKY